MAERLASGRHRLSRDEVTAHQKQRLFKALVAVMGTKGFNNTSVDDMIKHAGVSRATFYQHFDSKLDCFMAGFADMQRHAMTAIQAVPATGTPMERFGVMLHRYLGFMALDPRVARLYLLEVYAAGPEAIRRRAALQQEFVAGVGRVFKARSKADRFACQALVAAVSAMVTTALIDDNPDAILALEAPVLKFAERALRAGPG
ncbi:TetR/AcrR family transcriptional regulator [Mycolicibacterium parafortuitum]|uniref:TetR family transcriptional regulator [Thermomonospora curvata DSM] n=1 Tax=Mycolicibacterium parafortuitum TaxID=39692 RepID=A0A375YGI0_MYCPF|nr:TetR/AcrR family transcriptional regulator [Mycolicibacterium parafortuitum]ORB28047.1 TetR family transcriptional regulator [Mycolicibacterium parafortuitum]SRX80149.1 TetR family transcriptional regulator [Thermomonospora curvata DSM] [Mycolicibacterium parafortuitum]